MATSTGNKPISSFIETSTIPSNGMFPYIVQGDLDNYIASLSSMSESIRSDIQTLTLQRNSVTAAIYDGSANVTFNVTPNNIGTYTSVQIDDLIASVVAESFIRYTEADIITSGTYTVDPKRDMMYEGTISSDVTLNFSGLTTSSYGTTYMFIRNTDTTNSHTITLTGSSYYLPNTNVITVPAATNIEIATKSYGTDSVTTYLIGVPGEESDYVTYSQMTAYVASQLSSYLTKALADTYYAPLSHTHSVLTMQVEGTTKTTYNAGSAAIFNVTASDLSVYTKVESDAKYATASHTHANLVLQVNGTTKVTYDAGTTQTFNVTPTDLNVYTKTETYTQAEVNNLISSGVSNALIQATENTNSVTSNVLNYTMYSNKNTYKYLETTASFSIAESGSTAIACNTEFDLYVKNTGTSTITITLPSGTNDISYASDVDVDAGTGIEIIVLGYGLRRITTYLPFDN